jgi:NAD(P)-dependent dehydrogenase (short-subunit alcohol dehydrogenase family)
MAKLDFREKWVLVTGASSGLGREMARYLAKKENAHLVIAARRKERLQALKQEIEAACNSRVEVLEADVSSAEGVDQLFKKSIRDVWEKGITIRTEYDHPGDLPGKGDLYANQRSYFGICFLVFCHIGFISIKLSVPRFFCCRR